MRRVVFAVIAVVLVNLPWANDAWVQHQISSSGVDVQATVVKDAQKHGDNFLSYRLPASTDPQQHLYGVQVSAQAYRDAVASGHITARVVPGSPGKNTPRGQTTSPLVYVIAAIGDAIIALLLGVAVIRRRRWTRFTVKAVDDDLLTVETGSTELTVRLAEDPETQKRIHPAIGARIRGVLYLVPDQDVVEGPPIGEITHLEAATYRIAGRVRAVSPVRTDVMLENGYVMAVIGDEVEHEAELRGAVTATGTLLLAARRP